LFAVHGGVSTDDVKEYIGRCKEKQPVKLLSTPDSLYKITSIPGIYEEYHLVIDEFHQLIGMMNKRERAAQFVLSEFSKFKKFTFVSATPIEEDFLPQPLNNLDYYNLEISNCARIMAVSAKTDKPFNKVVDIIKNFMINGEFKINQQSSKHLYFFVNSVTNICRIIKASGLNHDQVNIICADTGTNANKLSSVHCGIGEFLTEEELKIAPQMEAPVHLITSTAFQGSDIYSNDGLAFFVANCHVRSTISGMSIVQQISGRIRTKSNSFNGIIYHIFNTNKAALSYEAFLEDQQKRIDYAMEIIAGWKTATEPFKESMIRTINHAEMTDESIYCFMDDEGNLKLNDLKIKADRYTHKVENLIYTSGIEVKKAYTKQGLNTIPLEYSKAESAMNNLSNRRDFKDYCISYHQFKTKKVRIGNPFFGCNEKTEKLIEEAYKVLGWKKIVELKYHQTRIKAHLAASISFNRPGIKKNIEKVLDINKGYSKSEIKTSLQNIYDKLNYKKTAMATDIYNYFECNECKLENGNKGIKLIRTLGEKSNGGFSLNNN
jgi:hypothetical protein